MNRLPTVLATVLFVFVCALCVAEGTAKTELINIPLRLRRLKAPDYDDWKPFPKKKVHEYDKEFAPKYDDKARLMYVPPKNWIHVLRQFRFHNGPSEKVPYLNPMQQWRWYTCTDYTYRIRKIKLTGEYDPKKLRIQCVSARAQNPASSYGENGCFGAFQKTWQLPLDKDNYPTATVISKRAKPLGTIEMQDWKITTLTWEKPLTWEFSRTLDSSANAVECRLMNGKKHVTTWRSAAVAEAVPFMVTKQVWPWTTTPDNFLSVRNANTAWSRNVRANELPKVTRWWETPGLCGLMPGRPTFAWSLGINTEPKANRYFLIDDRLDCLTHMRRSHLVRFSEVLEAREKTMVEVRKQMSIGDKPDFLQHEGCPIILSHRGAGSNPVAAENAALNLPKLAGVAAGVEVDVFYHPASDNVYALHDDNLERLLGFPADFTRTSPKQLSWLLKQTNCGGMMTPLSEILYKLKGLAMVADIELKPGNPFSDPEMPKDGDKYAKHLGQKVGDLVRSLNLYDSVIVSSFDPEKLVWVNKDRPKSARVKVAHATYLTKESKALAWYAKYVKWGFKEDAHLYHYSQITPSKVTGHHKKGRAVGTYTVFDELATSVTTAEWHRVIRNLVKSRVDWIETDDPRRLGDILKRECAKMENKAQKPFSKPRKSPSNYRCPTGGDMLHENAWTYEDGYCFYLGKGGKACDEVCESVGMPNLSAGAIWDTKMECSSWRRALNGHKGTVIERLVAKVKDQKFFTKWDSKQDTENRYAHSLDISSARYPHANPNNPWRAGVSSLGGGILGGPYYGTCELSRQAVTKHGFFGRFSSFTAATAERIGVFPGDRWKHRRFGESPLTDNSKWSLVCACGQPGVYAERPSA